MDIYEILEVAFLGEGNTQTNTFARAGEDPSPWVASAGGGGHGKPSLNERGRNTNTQIPRGFKIMQSGAKAFAFLSLSATDVGVQV